MKPDELRRKMEKFSGSLEGKSGQTLTREIDEISDAQVEAAAEVGRLCRQARRGLDWKEYKRFLRGAAMSELQANAAIDLSERLEAGASKKALRAIAWDVLEFDPSELN